MNKINIILIICIIACAAIGAVYALDAEPNKLYEVNGEVEGYKVSFISTQNISDTKIEHAEGYDYLFSESQLVNVYVGNEDSILGEKIAITKNRESFNPQDVNGTIVYISEANVGPHAGETRFISFAIDRDTGIITSVSTPSANVTSFIMKHLEVLR